MICRTHKLQIENNEVVHILQTIPPFSVQFREANSSLLINQSQLQNWSCMSLESIYLSTGTKFEELKKYLSNSPFSSILRTKFGKLSRQDQLRIIGDLAILSEIDCLHFKNPQRNFLIDDLDHFLLSLQRPAIVETMEPCRLKSASWRIDDLEMIDLKNCLPENLDKVDIFASKQRFIVQLIQTNEGPSLNIGDLNFLLENEQAVKVMGIMNQQLVMTADSADFEVSRKPKKGFLKMDIQQSFIGGRWLQQFKLQNQVLTRMSYQRARTPFLFIRPNLDHCWLYSVESRKRVFPSDFDH